jgi:hypothetical protein
MANSYLARTPSGAGNTKTFTLSAWLKGHNADVVGSGYFFTADVSGGSNIDAIGITASGIQVSVNSANSGALNSTRLLRDLSAWYHIVWAVDTTQATASNRMKVYVNGEQVTSWDTETYPSQNYDFAINGTTQHNVSYRSGLFQGYMSHVAFVDGQQLTPTSFGETDSTSGIWKFKAPSGLSWGTNGFHLKFENSANLGLDSSGQTNNYTVNGDLKQALDTPSNVYATFNPLHFGDTISTSYGTFSNGNTTYASTQSGSPYPYTCSTLAASSGKWYAEFKILQVAGSSMVGITDGNKYAYLGDGSNKDACLFADGQFYPGNSSFGSAFSDNDICGVAMDLDNMKVYFHKNGTYFQSGDPTSGATGTGAANIPTGGLGQFHFAFGDSSGNTTSCSANFGNGFFGTTAITSAGANGNGSLFEYDVPTGYYALNTKNINTYG